MQCIILADETVKEELLDRGLVPGTDILWTRDPSLILSHAGADAILDMLFTNSKERLNLLRQASPALIVINSVEHTLEETDPDFVRINGWPTMLRSDLVEAAGPENLRGRTEEIFACFHRKVEWVPDEPGFITPRIISMIINEA